jgi:hypothetical protein
VCRSENLTDSLNLSWSQIIYILHRLKLSARYRKLSCYYPTGITARCGLWPVKQYPSIFSYLPLTLSIIVKSIQLLLCSNFVIISFLLCGVVSPTPKPQTGGPGYPFLSGSSPLTCLAREALPVAYATASIALGIMWPHKPHHYVKVGIPSGGNAMIGVFKGLTSEILCYQDPAHFYKYSTKKCTYFKFFIMWTDYKTS